MAVMSRDAPGTECKKGGKFKCSTVQIKGVVGMAYWPPCVTRGGLGASSPHSRTIVGPLRHEGGFGGDPPPHSRGIVGPFVLFNCDESSWSISGGGGWYFGSPKTST